MLYLGKKPHTKISQPASAYVIHSKKLDWFTSSNKPKDLYLISVLISGHGNSARAYFDFEYEMYLCIFIKLLITKN